MPQTLDAIDAKILDLIQKDAALSVAEIADRVGLSSSPCWRRIKRMEEAGIIQAAILVIDELFVQRPANALGDAALDLALDIVRMNRPADILALKL